MFTLIRRPFSKMGRPSPWLGNDERLFTLRLRNLKSPLSAYAIWDATYEEGKDVKDEHDQPTKKRLQEALRNHPFITVGKDEQKRRQPVPKIFTDVVVWVPKEDWDRDVQLGGRNLEIMTDNLANLHKEDFEKMLWSEDRTPSYVVMPDPKLKKGEVLCQFGMGVFVPLAGDKLRAELHMKIEGKSPWMPLPQWVFWEDGRRIVRPAGLYEQQQYLMIGPQAAIHPPESQKGALLWFDHGKGHLLLNCASPTDPISHGDGKCLCEDAIMRQEDACTCVFNDATHVPKDAADVHHPLLLKIVPLQDAPPDDIDESEPGQFNSGSFVWGDSETFKTGEDESPTTSKTIVPGEDETMVYPTLVPGSRGTDCLILEGVVLPRIDTTTTRIANLESWIIWLDDSGRLVSADFSEKARAFSSAATQSHLSHRAPGETSFSPIKTFPFEIKDGDGNVFEVLASPISERYHGVLQLPYLSEIYELQEGTTIIGRMDSPPGGDRRAIALSLLDLPGTLRWKRGKEDPGRTMNHWLSNQHLELIVEDETVKARCIGSAPVYGLDEEGHLKQTLNPKSDDEMVLSDSDRLVVGCYLLRFESA